MADLIHRDAITGKDCYASTRVDWHNKGYHSVKGAMNVHEVAEATNMLFTFDKYQTINVPKMLAYLSTKETFTREEFLNALHYVNSYGVYRSDSLEHMAEVGKNFNPCQFETAFSFVDSLVNNIGGSHYETAGILGKGEKFFLTVKLPWSIAPNRSPEDKTDCYLLFTSANDGTGCVTCKLTTTRVVCNNTLQMALGSKGLGGINIKHSSQLDVKLTEAKSLITSVKATVESVQAKLSVLAERKITEASRQQIFSKIFEVKNDACSTKTKNNIEAIEAIYESNDSNAFPEIKGSAYNLLNAFTNFTDHNRSVKNTNPELGLSTEAIRYQSGIFGSGSLLKDKALEIILEETENAPPMEKILTSVSMPSSLDNILSNVAI